MLNSLMTTFAATTVDCDKIRDATFFGIPAWYKYLELKPDAFNKCVPDITYGLANISDYWLIALAIVDMLIRVAGMVAVGFVIYAGIQYILSSGSPEKTKGAKDTMLNAVIGLVIAILAATIVSFIGRSIV